MSSQENDQPFLDLRAAAIQIVEAANKQSPIDESIIQHIKEATRPVDLEFALRVAAGAVTNRWRKQELEILRETVRALKPRNAR